MRHNFLSREKMTADTVPAMMAKETSGAQASSAFPSEKWPRIRWTCCILTARVNKAYRPAHGTASASPLAVNQCLFVTGGLVPTGIGPLLLLRKFFSSDSDSG